MGRQINRHIIHCQRRSILQRNNARAAAVDVRPYALATEHYGGVSGDRATFHAGGIYQSINMGISLATLTRTCYRLLRRCAYSSSCLKLVVEKCFVAMRYIWRCGRDEEQVRGKRDKTTAGKGNDPLTHELQPLSRLHRSILRFRLFRSTKGTHNACTDCTLLLL